MSAMLEETSVPTTDSAAVASSDAAVGATVASDVTEVTSVGPITGPTPAENAAAQTPVEPDEARDEAERIEPVPTGPVTLANGQEVEIVPLKLRETMKLLKIVTRGAGGVLEQLMGELDVNDPVAFAQTFGALILLSIPEAENEVVDFVVSMVRPAEWDALSQEQRIEGLKNIAVELANPELDDVISIVERIVRRESEDIRSLGKRLSQAFSLGRKVGEIAPAAK